LARGYEQQGRAEAAAPHRARARVLVQDIEASLEGSGLQARLTP
jgi:hypothetical protein